MATRRERRRAPRKPANLLTSYSEHADKRFTPEGYVRTLNVSKAGVLIESPDPFFRVGQTLSLEFLLDENRVVKVEGRVIRVDCDEKGCNQVGIAFRELEPQVEKLIEQQVET